MTFRDFLLNYDEVALIFFSSNYYLNQVHLRKTYNTFLLSCRITSTFHKNNCYLMLAGFPKMKPTKVTIYKQLTEE